MVVGPCNTRDEPTRILEIEVTVKGGKCRSCFQCLTIGEPRVKVSYPNVVVQYAARIGVPSFFMHPECFSTYPVDFIRIGKTAFKETTQVMNYIVNPELDIVGWNKFPHLHHYFSKCELPVPGQQEPCQAPSLFPESVADQYDQEFFSSSDALFAQPDNSFKMTVNSFGHDVNTAPTIKITSPQERRAHHPDVVASTTKLPDNEDSKDPHVDPMHSSSASSKLTYIQQPEPQTSTICTCLCHSLPSETVQWMTPREAAKTVGVSPAFLQSLAVDRAIPILRRPSGRRLYSIASIRKFIDDNTVHPVSLKKQRLQ